MPNTLFTQELFARNLADALRERLKGAPQAEELVAAWYQVALNLGKATGVRLSETDTRARLPRKTKNRR